jgi:hypothetical protein
MFKPLLALKYNAASRLGALAPSHFAISWVFREKPGNIGFWRIALAFKIEKAWKYSLIFHTEIMGFPKIS